jgi:hypothetical protein
MANEDAALIFSFETMTIVLDALWLSKRFTPASSKLPVVNPAHGAHP